MAYDLEEQEKLDALRAWWDRYGTLISALVLAAVVAFAGWRGWQWYENHQAAQAMGYFEALEDAARQDGDEGLARVKAASATLRKDFADSGYSSRGALIAAEALQRHGDRDAAREQLRWLIDDSPDRALAPVASLRLAGILLTEKKYDEALALLGNPPAEFAGLYADRRGDILYAQGKPAEARKAWETALGQADAQALAPIVQLKIDALGA